MSDGLFDVTDKRTSWKGIGDLLFVALEGKRVVLITLTKYTGASFMIFAF